MPRIVAIPPPKRFRPAEFAAVLGLSASPVPGPPVAPASAEQWNGQDNTSERNRALSPQNRALNKSQQQYNRDSGHSNSGNRKNWNWNGAPVIHGSPF